MREEVGEYRDKGLKVHLISKRPQGNSKANGRERGGNREWEEAAVGGTCKGKGMRRRSSSSTECGETERRDAKAGYGQ